VFEGIEGEILGIGLGVDVDMLFAAFDGSL
jgi:hypothetical protein